VGNKSDLSSERAIEEAEAKEFAKTANSAQYIEVSVRHPSLDPSLAGIGHALVTFGYSRR
jgi:hypothetical protein